MNNTIYSIILVTWNNIYHTVRCVESVLQTLPEESEVIVVDNGSSDGTSSYLREMCERYHGIMKTIFLDKNHGWCKSINIGLEKATVNGNGNYLVFLNNDVIVTPGWLEGLRECTDHAPSENAGIRKVGLAGPVTNNVGGPQQITDQVTYDLSTLNLYARHHKQQYHRQYKTSFFLSGFCMMMSRDCYEEVGGLDETFSPGGFDDNDLVLRVQERGWDSVIAQDVFVHHAGSATFNKMLPENRNGLINRRVFTQKWKKRRAGKKCLVAAYRVKDCETTIEQSLNATARFADRIIILDDGSTDSTGAICKRHPAVSCYKFQYLPFDERRDRNKIFSMAGEFNPDWIIVIDGDEIFEMDNERAERLMYLNDPHIKVLGFHWYTFWEPSHTYFRADGIFGMMAGYRMYKYEPNQCIVAGTQEGLHCGNIPQFPDGVQRITNIRVRHLGYDSEKKRKSKYNFYKTIDINPRADLVGNETYSHLVSPNVMIRKYSSVHGVSLCLITKNEEQRLEAFLSFYEQFVDEICIVDTGSTDRTLEIARQFTGKIELFHSETLELDKARNRCIALADHPWILSFDPDEEISPRDLFKMQRLTDDPEPYAYSFQISNHQKDGPLIMTLAIRLFKNDRRIYYTRPVHETVEESLQNIPGLVIKPSHIPVQHYGFLKDDKDVNRKIINYFTRNKEYRETKPNDPLPWYNEALHYLNEGKEEEAVSFLRRALELDPAFLSPYAQLAYIYQERSISLWQNLLEKTPYDHPTRNQAEQNLVSLKTMTPPRPVVGDLRKRLKGD